MATKKALKSIKLQLKDENYEDALFEAGELRKKLKKNDPEAAEVLMYQGLALVNLKQNEEAEKSYLMAYNLQPESALAETGIRKFYEKTSEWQKLGRFLEVVLQVAFNAGDGEKCASVLQDLLTLRITHGPEDSLYRTIRLLLPSSPLVRLLQSITAPAGSYTPFPTPLYPPASFAFPPSLPKTLPHPTHLAGSLALLLNLLIRQQSLVQSKIEAEVKAGRSRIGGGSEKDVRRTVEAKILGGEMGLDMVDLLREVGGHPGVEEGVRRKVEIQEFDFWRKLVGALSAEPATKKPKAKPKAKVESTDSVELPPTPLFDPKEYTPPTKAEALARADDLANGFVLLEVGDTAEDAWRWVLEGKDEPTIFYDLDFLHKFAKIFPLSPLTDFIDDYCRWFHLPLPEPEDEPLPPTGDQPLNGESDKAATTKKKQTRKPKKGMNAKDRRKARRLAGRDGALAENIEEEEKEDLIASMTKLLVDKLPKSIWGNRVMSRIALQEEDWNNAVGFAEKGRFLIKELEGERGIKLVAAKLSLDTALGVALVSYFSPKHHSRATRLLNDVLHHQPTNNEARFARAQIFQASGNWSEAKKNFEMILDIGSDDQVMMVAAREEVGWCLVNQGKLEEGREILEQIVEMRDQRWEQEGKTDEAFARARAWYRLGTVEWMIGDDEAKVHAEEWFTASIRALPTFAPSYTSLGICYSSATPPDDDRASRCFQKAFELDATEADAARRLAIGYANDDEWALVRAIATRVMEGEGGVEGVAGGEVMNAKGRFAPKNGWAWKALGSTEMYYRNFAKAGNAFQIALRASPDDVSTWVLLGESYVKCGRHIAGLKALQKALELDPTNWMAYFHIADIHVQLYQYELAIEAFEQVIQLGNGEEQVGVTSALANAKFLLGKQTGEGGFRERSRRAFHDSIVHAGKVLDLRGHRAWAWKLIGDACFELSQHEPDLKQAEETASILRPIMEALASDDTDKRGSIASLGHVSTFLQAPIKLDSTLKSAVFAFAYRAYLCKNDRTADDALYDLATSLHALAIRSVDESQKKGLMKTAIESIRSALDRNAGDERLWNALGVICGDAGQAVAQHAFVVSLELYEKDPITWTNLGYLYLKLDDRDLANQCFLKAQIIDPDYARAWLGQGMLAERKGERDHARGLFAHAVTLSAGSLLEADMAAAALTFEKSLGSDFFDTALLHQPAFALKHYCHQRPYDFTAAHLYALLCERLGLIDESIGSLEKAVHLLEEEYEKSESPEIEVRYSIALANLGRVCLSDKRYHSADEAYTNCWGLVEGNQDPLITSLRVQVRLGQAIAKYWMDSQEGSLECFEMALREAEENGKKGDKEAAAVILARTLWGLGGEEAKEAAKSHLMECLSSETPPISVITVLGAIAIASKDSDLLEAVLAELHGLSPDRRALEDTATQVESVLTAHSLVEGKTDEAISILTNALTIHPTSFNIANRLAKMMVANGKPEDAIDLLALAGNWDETATRLRGQAKLLHGDDTGLSEVQRSIKLKPWEMDGWEALAWSKNIIAEAETQLEAPNQ